VQRLFTPNGKRETPYRKVQAKEAELFQQIFGSRCDWSGFKKKSQLPVMPVNLRQAGSTYDQP